MNPLVGWPRNLVTSAGRFFLIVACMWVIPQPNDPMMPETRNRANYKICEDMCIAITPPEKIDENKEYKPDLQHIPEIEEGHCSCVCYSCRSF